MKRNTQWLAAAIIAGSAGFAFHAGAAECYNVERSNTRVFKDGALEAYRAGEPVRVTRTSWIERRPSVMIEREGAQRFAVETRGPTLVSERAPVTDPVSRSWIEQRPAPVAERIIYTDAPVRIAEGEILEDAPLRVAERRVTTTQYRKVSKDSKACSLKAERVGEKTKRSVKKHAKKTGRTLEKAAHKTGEKLEAVGERIGEFFEPMPERITTTTSTLEAEPVIYRESDGPWYPSAAFDYNNPYR